MRICLHRLLTLKVQCVNYGDFEKKREHQAVFFCRLQLSFALPPSPELASKLWLPTDLDAGILGAKPLNLCIFLNIN